VRCVYVAIGQKMSTIGRVVHTLEEKGVLGNCIVVVASASDSAPMQYIAPFAGCAMAEHFPRPGRRRLIVYDDLYKHAVAYRQISLVLRRPPGREAFRATSSTCTAGCWSARPAEPGQGRRLADGPAIVETQQGDYAAYIPTNLISITDGQIYWKAHLFYQGFRPAITTVGLRRVARGGQGRSSPRRRKSPSSCGMEFAQYRELAAFAR